MIMSVVLGHPSHPEYGVATIPFPIPREQYDHSMELLVALEIGDVCRADCKVISIDSYYTVLKRMEGLPVNVDELDYLAKRLDSFDVGEAAQFQAMAHKLELFEAKDLINLTFCCQQATVITDFSDLNKVGRDHYMNLHGGSAPTAELDALDGEETARLLIDNGDGIITPYGVVYDNGMKLEELYDGTHLPCYYYEPNLLTLTLCERATPLDTEAATWLFMPMAQAQLDRAILRAGIVPENRDFRFQESQFPDEIDAALQFETEDVYDLNALCEVCTKLNEANLAKLGAVCQMAQPENAREVRQLAENLDLFIFAPSVHTPEELGRYMIQQSGHFEYDPELDEFYNYADYGTTRLLSEDGVFTDRGYVSYHGAMTLDELMADDPAEEHEGELKDVYDPNALCGVCKKFDEVNLSKLSAVCQLAKPENAREIRQLAENLGLFYFALHVHTPEELGQYMIRQSGRFDYDPELDEFYNYADYGTTRLLSEDGVFTDRGYVSYHGTITLDELMRDDPAETFRQEMGGMEL